jgi:threonylcarbamoyladenosine tRNA methylthiotransferase MtaB
VAAGFREIVLTGVHLGSYGRDLSPSTSLSRLLSRLAEKDDDVLYRISSLEPMDCTRAIVDLVAGSRVMAPHFHLPLQHASNRVLEAMRRPYTIEQYRRLVDRIRERIPAASIGSDVIAGFPGERDEDADALASYLEASPLTHLHVFPYSDRPGTAASRLPERAPGAVVRERARRLREVGSALARRFGRAQTGAVRRGLTIEDGSLVVTDNYLKLRVAPGLARNRRVHVRVVAAGDGDDRGEVLPCGS